MNRDFVKLEGYGQLQVDKIFFEVDYPILFTCVNDTKDLFICVCCQSNKNGRKWLVSKTFSSRILKLLKNEISIRQILTENPDARVTVEEHLGKISIKYGDAQDWAENSIFLPKVGEYLDGDPGEFDDEMEYYCIKDSISYSSKYVQKISETLHPLQGQYEIFLDNSYMGTVLDVYTIHGEIIKNLKTINGVLGDEELPAFREAYVDYKSNDDFKYMAELKIDDVVAKLQMNLLGDYSALTDAA